MQLVKVQNLVIDHSKRIEFPNYYLTALPSVEFVIRYRAYIGQATKSTELPTEKYFTLVEVEEIGPLTLEQIQAMQKKYAYLQVFPES